MRLKLTENFKYQNLIIFTTHKNELLTPAKWRKQEKVCYQFILEYLKVRPSNSDKIPITQTFVPQLKQVILVKIGNDKESPSILSLGGQIGKLLLKSNLEQCSLLLPDHNKKNLPFFNQLPTLLEGILLGNYQFSEYITDPTAPQKRLKDLLIIGNQSDSLSKVIKHAEVRADSTNLARDCSNRPGNYLTPTQFKRECQQVAKETGLQFEALNETQMATQKMGCLLGVSKGSGEPAFLNILRHIVPPKKAPTIMLVGKGITFDSGGISLKPSIGMELMKHDMSGGAAVLGAMRMIGLLKPKINVIGLIPAVENLPGGNAIRRGDVLTACNGKTVEIISTDAEGRLILADALAYGVKKYHPDGVVDIATLTGACVVALGHYNMGMISNHNKVSERLIRAGKDTEEPVWPMPNEEVYLNYIKSKIADLKNVGGGAGGIIHGGQFLEYFVNETPWAHIDMAGMSNDVKHLDFQPKFGATGAGARLLAQFVLNWR